MHATTDQPRRHRLTVDDYYRMAEVGILDPEARTELLDGEIIDMGSPGSPHAGTVNYLNEVFRSRAVPSTKLRIRIGQPAASRSAACCGPCQGHAALSR